MSDNFESQQDWRYERKFLVEDCDMQTLEQSILSNQMYFRKLHAERQINNIYFDTEDFFCFVQNVDGQAARRKMRLRWYGDIFGRIANPVLEIKIKEALVGCKRRYRLQPFELSKSFDKKIISQCFASSDLPDTVANSLLTMPPTLLNSYTRRYYISADQRYRMTLDYNLSFYTVAAGGKTAFRQRKSDDLIIEIKYDAEDDNDIDLISTQFPFRMTKSSKYVQGISATLLNI
jgi:SPX domain protein involved in polyphosphate accumulation